MTDLSPDRAGDGQERILLAHNNDGRLFQVYRAERDIAELEGPVIEVIPAEHADALAEAIKQAERAAFPQGSPRTNEGYYEFHRAALAALDRFHRATHASTGKESDG